LRANIKIILSYKHIINIIKNIQAINFSYNVMSSSSIYLNIIKFNRDELRNINLFFRTRTIVVFGTNENKES